jgi:GntR family transcriptional regulator
LSSPQSLAASPRYRQIIDQLRGDIADGTLLAHAALPSERVIAEAHNVSRMTARRALEALEAEGLAYAENRRGRFVSPPRLKYDISRTISLAAHAQSEGMRLNIEVLDSREVAADARIAALLQVQKGEPLFEYTRLFTSDGHAIFIETESIIARRFPKMLEQDLQQSTTKLLEQAYNTHARTGDITIRMRAVHADEAECLGIAANHPGIELEQIISDESGMPFCVGNQIWRGELAAFSARAILGQ